MTESRKVVVTTEFRGVFFGELYSEDGNIVVLKQCRNCVYWCASNKGFLGLAANGPLAGSKVGPPAASTKLFGVTSISDCTPESIVKWEASPWS